MYLLVRDRRLYFLYILWMFSGLWLSSGQAVLACGVEAPLRPSESSVEYATRRSVIIAIGTIIQTDEHAAILRVERYLKGARLSSEIRLNNHFIIGIKADCSPVLGNSGLFYRYQRVLVFPHYDRTGIGVDWQSESGGFTIKNGGTVRAGDRFDTLADIEREINSVIDAERLPMTVIMVVILVVFSGLVGYSYGKKRHTPSRGYHDVEIAASEPAHTNDHPRAPQGRDRM